MWEIRVESRSNRRLRWWTLTAVQGMMCLQPPKFVFGTRGRARAVALRWRRRLEAKRRAENDTFTVSS